MNPGPYRPHGWHVVADLWGVDPEKASDEAFLAALAREAAELAGARVLRVDAHGFAALDAFMCGSGRPREALEHFARALGARTTSLRTLERGTPTPPGA